MSSYLGNRIVSIMDMDSLWADLCSHLPNRLLFSLWSGLEDNLWIRLESLIVHLHRPEE